MRLPHHPDAVAALRQPTRDDPWRVLISGCLMGLPVGVDGTSYGMSLDGAPWLRSPLIRLVPACPEDIGLGTPRPMPDLHGGDGFDVLDSTASIRGPDGADLTEGMLRGARAVRATARREEVDWALLTDRSAACGSQVISVGCRFDEPVDYRRGVGVSTAMLLRAGVPVVSQRDHLTLMRLRRRIDPTAPDPEGTDLRDHHQHPWVVANLGPSGT